jgi:hypothetical protein
VSTIDTAEYRKRLEDEKARLLHAVGFLEKENPGSISDELGELAGGDAEPLPGEDLSLVAHVADRRRLTSDLLLPRGH